jgi:hypothetical protein
MAWRFFLSFLFLFRFGHFRVFSIAFCIFRFSRAESGEIVYVTRIIHSGLVPLYLHLYLSVKG